MIESPRGRLSTPEEVATHEAGHVIVGDRLGLPLIEVDVLPDPEGGQGHTSFQPPPWFHPEHFQASRRPLDEPHREFVEALVVTFLAGAAAEARRAGFANPDSAGFDLDAIVRQWLSLLAPEQRDGQGLAELEATAQRLVDGNWAAIERLAAVLLERHRLSGSEALAAAVSAD